MRFSSLESGLLLEWFGDDGLVESIARGEGAEEHVFLFGFGLAGRRFLELFDIFELILLQVGQYLQMLVLLLLLRQLLGLGLSLVLILLVEVGHVLLRRYLIVRVLPLLLRSIDLREQVHRSPGLLLGDGDCADLQVLRQSLQLYLVKGFHESMQLEYFGIVEEGVDLLSLHGVVVELEPIQLDGEDNRHALQTHSLTHSDLRLAPRALHSFQFLRHQIGLQTLLH
jgi:hypothetical protein